MDLISTIDKKGRITLPEEVRESLGVFEGDLFRIAPVEPGNFIILARHTPTCFACNDDTDVQKLNRTFLCGECREAVSKTL